MVPRDWMAGSTGLMATAWVLMRISFGEGMG